MRSTGWTLGLGCASWAWASTSRRSATTTSTREVLPRPDGGRSEGFGRHLRRPPAEAAPRHRGAAAAGARRGTARPCRPCPAERRQLTVMFADLVGSTALSRRLDPEEMDELLRAHQDAVAGEVARFEGYVAKFMGDGVLAYFGWPSAHEDEAERAVRAGLAAVEAVGRLTAPTGEPLAARVGIATGLVVVGGFVGEGSARERDGRWRDAQPGRPPAGHGRARHRPHRRVDAAADRHPLRARGSRAAVDQGLCRGGRAWRVLGERRRQQPVRGARDRAPAAGRARAGGRAPARPLAAGPRRRGPGGAALGRARDWQVPHRPRARPASRRRAVRALWHQCSPYYADTALHPTIEHLEQAAGFRRDDPPAARLDKLEALLARGTDRASEAAPLIAALLSIPPGGATRRSSQPRSGRRRRRSTSWSSRWPASPAGAGALRVRGPALGRPDHAGAARPAGRADRGRAGAAAADLPPRASRRPGAAGRTRR